MIGPARRRRCHAVGDKKRADGDGDETDRQVQHGPAVVAAVATVGGGSDDAAGGAEALYAAPLERRAFTDAELVSADIFPATQPPTRERIERRREPADEL